MYKEKKAFSFKKKKAKNVSALLHFIKAQLFEAISIKPSKLFKNLSDCSRSHLTLFYIFRQGEKKKKKLFYFENLHN